MKLKVAIKGDHIAKLLSKKIKNLVSKEHKLEEDVQLFRDMNNMVKRIENDENVIKQL